MSTTKQPNQNPTNTPVAPDESSQTPRPQIDPATETTRMNLMHDVTINGVKYPRGRNVEVPKRQADDIARIDHDHQEQLNALHVKREYISNAGSISVGSGAE